MTTSGQPDDGPADQSITNAFERFIGSARWFGGKGRSFRVSRLQHLGWLPPGEVPPDDLPEDLTDAADNPAEGTGVHVRVELVTIAYDDASAGSGKATDTDVYQVPVAYYEKPQERLEHALIGQWEDPDLGAVLAYDALHDRYATALWLQAFEDRHRDERLTFYRVEGHDLDTETHGTLFSGEQSNSSVAFGGDSLMKVFRKVTPGRNPDIEIHQVLTEMESDHVAALYGWAEASPAPDAPVEEQPIQLAMLQQFLRTASDGWDLALASVRDLFAEGDLHADEVGGDFAAEAHRLGVATAEVHEALHQHFPDEQWEAKQLTDLAEAMRRRLADAVEVVPELAQHAEALGSTYDALASIDAPVVAQRVHGDLHLGQTLRTVRGWKIVDFEGEPAKPLAERVRLDSAWRDVAGMLRSFDYAAHAVERDLDEGDLDEGAQIAYRALEWAERNRTAFMEGYVEATGSEGLSPTDRLLVTAYETDKAVYEAVYEARNRPTWVSIPVDAIERLTRETASDHEEVGNR